LHLQPCSAKTIIQFKLLLVSAFTLIFFTACNNADKSSKPGDISKNSTDSSNSETSKSAQIKEITPTYTDVDPKLASSLKAIIDHYLHIKNSLVNNNESEAANGGNAMYDAITKVDKSFFTIDQKKVYDGIEDNLKEHAKHISKSKIDRQREHFAMMSEDAYDVVKAFGAGREVYHDHCPMANDNKGAIWLSETKEIRNPYFGGKMNECVKVPEVIKQL
jgi:hypothetical protein